MEAAGLILGIVPIIVEAVKSYRTTYKAIQNIRHCPREVFQVRRVLEAHRAVFENECRLLWTLVVRALPSADALLEQEILEPSSLAEAEMCFENVLGENYQPCWSLVEIIREGLRHIDKDLTTFSRTNHEQDKSALRDQARQIRNAFTLAFRKSDYLQKLDQIKAYLETFRTLRSGIESLHFQSSNFASRKPLVMRNVPPRYQVVRGASSRLYDALEEAWQTSCFSTSHIEHKTILCLNAKVDTDISSNIAVSCEQGLEPLGREPPVSERLIWLRVRSTLNEEIPRFRIKDHGIMLQHDRPTISSAIGSTLGNEVVLASRSVLPNESSRGAQRASPLSGTAQKQNHRWWCHNGRGEMAESINISSSTGREGSVPGVAVVEFQPINPRGDYEAELDKAENLCQNGGICRRLQQLTFGLTSEAKCLGYLESPGSFKHVFYTAQQDADNPTLETSVSLVELLRSATDESMEVPDQIKIAHKVAVALLQFQSTPWLPSHWDIDRFHLFGSVANILDSALDTLHLSASFSGKAPVTYSGKDTQAFQGDTANKVDDSSVPSLTRTASDQSSTTAEEAGPDTLLYGINNMALCCLGVALSAIGHRKPLQDLKLENEPNHIITARRLSNGPIHLGRKYQEIVRKCLSCDFSAGFTLETRKLQSAVYSEVVVTLEDMMKSLTI